MSKLDLRTKLFLYLTGLNAVEPSMSKIEISETKMTDVYVFNSYQEYVDFLKLYLKNIDENLINNAITTTLRGKQIVVLKKLCDNIIIKQRVKEFYESYDQNRISEIHSKGKITPLEKVTEYETYNLCAPSSTIESVRDRCKFFSNCHDCLLEYATYQEEYDEIDSKSIKTNIFGKVLKK